MRDGMAAVGIPANSQEDLMQLVAAVLWLGNIEFDGSGTNMMVSKSQGAQQAVRTAAELLAVEVSALSKAVTHRSITTRGETITTPLTGDECYKTRDALSKALYARAFESLVGWINDAIRTDSGKLSIGVLDIYGFEIFENNSFEQLCINYCNEKLQQLFIELTLKAEQEEYAREGIKWEEIKYFNNKVVCDLIEGKRPPGVIAFLDEESVFPRATDKTLAQKLDKNLSRHAHFESHDRTGVFVIKHYAGDVAYSPNGMLDKNKDTLYRDLLELVGKSSRSNFLNSLFPEALQAVSHKKPVTAGTQFRTQMQALVDTLYKCEPHYIRCIKPNDEKRSGIFNVERVQHQVRYLGLLENVRVRRAGFAYRQVFDRFVARYKMLSDTTWPFGSGDVRRDTTTILQEMGVASDAYQFGKTKVFVRKPITLFSLEEMRERKLHDIARLMQSTYRSWKARKYFLEMREKSMGIFSGRKRRRGSWVLYFLGDYVDARESIPISKIMALHGDQRVLFADTVVKINRNWKSQERILMITERAIYTLAPPKMKATNRVALSEITGISMSTFADGFFVMHINPGAKDAAADFLFQSFRKAEITTVLAEEVANDGGRELNLSFQDRFNFRFKGGGFFKKGTETRSLVFSEDSSNGNATATLEPKVSNAPLEMRVKVGTPMGSKAVLQLTSDAPVRALSKFVGGGKRGRGGRKMSVGQRGYGGSAKSSEAPPPPTKGRSHGKSFSSFPKARVKYDYAAASAQDLPLKTGEVIDVVEQFDDGWWNGHANGKTGLFPASYVELL